MYRFFIEPHQLYENTIRVYDSDFHHMKDVIRLRPGEELSFYILGDYSREYICSLASYETDHALCDVTSVSESKVELPCRITLYQGLPKGDKMETVIQKTTELGVCRIVPLATARSIVKLDPKKAAKKQERWQEIAKSAAKQSHRALIPQIAPVCSFKEALGELTSVPHILIPYELAEDMKRTRELLGTIAPGEDVAVFIGPEGGFTEEEIRLAREAGAEPITLGRRILRTETAGMTFLSFLVYLLEE